MSDLIILDNKEQQENIQNTPKNSISLYDKINNAFLSLQKMKVNEKAIFFRLVSVMIDAGITLIKAVSILEKQEKNKFIKTIYNKFLDNLRDGQTLSDCLEEFPATFTESEIGMIRSGEKTGKLNETLLNIAEQSEKMNTILTKLKGAMMYPLMIIIVVIGVIIIMMVVIVPRILDIFDDKSALPLATRILISVSDIMVKYGLFILIGFGFLFMLFLFWKKTERGKFILDSVKLNIPKFGMIYKKFLLSRFARTFSSLISSGVSVVESLKIVAGSIGNEIYKQRILLLIEDVKSGIKIWESIDSDPLFPEIMVQMIQVGEQTATLDKTIIRVADFYDEQFNETIAVINKLLEPLIIVFLAVTVGFIAVAIMQPIMGLADQIAAT